MNKLKIGVLFLVFFVPQCIYSEVILHGLFTDNMVIQRDSPIHIWGWADAGENIQVIFKEVTREVKASMDGSWSVIFPPSGYGGPYEITLTASNRIVLKNVLIGDVWFCSGQSNMEMSVAAARNAEMELKDIDYPQVRLFTIPPVMSESKQDNIIQNRWTQSDLNSVSSFSAVAYFFGRELNRKLNIPIGLINCSWSGTNIQTWTSKEAISNFVQYQSALKKLETEDYSLFSKKREVEYKQWSDTLRFFENGTVNKWYTPDFDDKDWSNINLPFVWNSIGYNGNGVGWFRKRFNLSEEEASSNVLFMLGTIQTGDEVYLNGEKIGECYVADQSRIYSGHPSQLREGENVLSIKVYNEWGNGGFSGKKEDIYMQTKYGRKSLGDSWKFKAGYISPNPSLVIHPTNYPTLLFNAMVNPIVKYPIKGVIWYQGENNSDNPKEYKELLPAMINDWRQKWNMPYLPFLIVQIPNFMHDGGQPPFHCNWALLREAQSEASDTNTHLVVTIDIGEADNIHPSNKQDVAHRLVLQALSKVYDKPLIASGPVFKKMIISGNKAFIYFKDTGAELITRDKYGYVRGFAIAGADKKFYWAKAKINGDDEIEVYSDKVSKPVAVRYGWSFSPDVSLYNCDGLPAVPFRTDNWD